MTGRIANGTQGEDANKHLVDPCTDEVLVGLAEIRIAKGPANFAFIGLGSCIAFVALDPVADIAGAAHIMLPKSGQPVKQEHLGKFADTAVGELVRLMESHGAKKENITAAYAGGASLAEVDGAAAKFDIGSRNLDAIKAVLDTLKIPVKATDAGGNTGRTLKMATSSGDVTVKTIKLGEAVLCSLRG